MKIYIRYIFATLALFISAVSYSQKVEETRHVERDSVKIDVKYKTRYTAPFWSNLFLQGNFAGRVIYGEEDNGLPFFKRLKPGFTIGIGKQIHPDFGIKLSFGGMRLDGWNRTDTYGVYKQYAGWAQNKDPMKEYYESQGVDTSNGYVHQMKFLEGSADILFDLGNIFTKYNHYGDRKWRFDAYLGLGFIHIMRWRGTSRNSKITLRSGLITTYKITPELGLNFTIGNSMTSSTIDGVIGKGGKLDHIGAMALGLKYSFGKQGFKTMRLVSQSEMRQLTNAMAATRQEEIKNVTIERMVMDTTMLGGLLIPSVVFFPNKAEYNKELQQVNLYRIALFMNLYKDITITIVGNIHKSQRYIAEKRVDIVRRILIQDYGINPKRLKTDVYDLNKRFGVQGYEHSVSFTFYKEE